MSGTEVGDCCAIEPIEDYANRYAKPHDESINSPPNPPKAVARRGVSSIGGTLPMIESATQTTPKTARVTVSGF